MVDVIIRARCFLNAGVTFAFERRYDSAADNFACFLTMVEVERTKLNYAATQLLSAKFALCCCYFYAERNHESNLELLQEFQNSEIPAAHYMTAAILYKLNL